MKVLGEAIISLFNLVEAEGRALKKNVVRLVSLAVFFIIGAILAIAGFILLLAGLHTWLAERFGSVAAYFATGAGALAAAGALFFCGLRAASGKEERGEKKIEKDGEAEPVKGDDGRGSKRALAPRLRGGKPGALRRESPP